MTDLEKAIEAIENGTASVEQIKLWAEYSARASCGPIGEAALKQLIQQSVIAKGYPIGWHDSTGVELKVGDVVRRLNGFMYGDWVEYEIILKGLIPVLSYLRSEKHGDALPKGHSVVSLSEFYDFKELFNVEGRLCAKDSMALEPIEEIYIQSDVQCESEKELN